MACIIIESLDHKLAKEHSHQRQLKVRSCISISWEASVTIDENSTNPPNKSHSSSIVGIHKKNKRRAQKGDNDILEMVNLLEHTRDANAVSESHVPKNRDT